MIRGVRDISIEETVELLDETMDSDDSIALLCGDFNITRYPFNQIVLGRLFAHNPGIAGYLDPIESEYEGLVEALKNDGQFAVADCWVRDNDDDFKFDDKGSFDPYSDKNCITFGDTRAVPGTNGQK